MANNTKQQGNNIMATVSYTVNSSNKAKQHNNKIDAAAWSDTNCHQYDRFMFVVNRI